MDRDPRQLQSEINQLIKKQLETLGREIFGGVTTLNIGNTSRGSGGLMNCTANSSAQSLPHAGVRGEERRGATLFSSS
jgi:hypothetical protein